MDSLAWCIALVCILILILDYIVRIKDKIIENKIKDKIIENKDEEIMIEWTLEDAKKDYAKKHDLPILLSKNCENCKFLHHMLSQDNQFYGFNKCQCDIIGNTMLKHNDCEYFTYSDDVKKKIEEIENDK